MKKVNKQLVLSCETVRALSAVEMRTAMGGWDWLGQAVYDVQQIVASVVAPGPNTNVKDTSCTCKQ